MRLKENLSLGNLPEICCFEMVPICVLECSIPMGVNDKRRLLEFFLISAQRSESKINGVLFEQLVESLVFVCNLHVENLGNFSEKTVFIKSGSLVY